MDFISCKTYCPATQYEIKHHTFFVGISRLNPGRRCISYPKVTCFMRTKKESLNSESLSCIIWISEKCILLALFSFSLLVDCSFSFQFFAFLYNNSLCRYLVAAQTKVFCNKLNLGRRISGFQLLILFVLAGTSNLNLLAHFSVFVYGL